MTDWKEGIIRKYHILERGKQMAEEEMAKNPSLSKLRLQIKDAQQQLIKQEQEYREDIHNCDWEMQKIREDLVEQWDIEDKSFKCDEGGITIRTTRTFIIDNVKALTTKLIALDKLGTCIKSWDVTYLRKLADANIFDNGVAHYDEKRNVIISDAIKENDRDEE